MCGSLQNFDDNSSISVYKSCAVIWRILMLFSISEYKLCTVILENLKFGFE